jgi:NADH-quinone oxidoreductase subunit K
MISNALKIGIEHYVVLSSIIFSIGIAGILLNRKTIINVLISIELMLVAVNINFVAFSYYIKDIVGQIFTIFILTVAASEVAIGLAIIVIYYRNKNSIDINQIKELRG